jgi:hypothetical protein
MYDDAYGRRSSLLQQVLGVRRTMPDSSGELEARVRENVRVRPFVNSRRCAALRDRTGQPSAFQ